MVSEKLLLITDKTIELLKIYPFVSPNFLLAIVFDYEVHVYECTGVEKDGSSDEINLLDAIRLPAFVKQLSWSPDTSLQSAPQLIKFFTADSDHRIRCIRSDLKGSRTETVIGEHKSFVNSIAVHPQKGNLLASTADDNLCCIWNNEDAKEKAMTFDLTSPGMSVCWHPSEPSKLMVAEKCGVIRFYSVDTKQAFMSLECGHLPLIHAHWSPANPLDIAAVAGTDLFVFDTSLSSQAQMKQKVHPSGGTFVMWCPSNEKFLVTTGGPRFQVKVNAVKTLQTSTCLDLKSVGSVDIHPVLPLVFVACDNKIQIFPITC